MNSPVNHSRTVLVVDDNEDDRRIISQWLLEHSFEVHEAEDGEAALKLAENISPKIIILDVNMPKMDGFVTCQRIMQKHEHETAVIFLSIKDEDHDVLDGYIHGAAHYIAKPDQYDREFFNKFKAVIEKALGKSVG